MQLDVEKHQALREFNDKTIAEWMDNWRVKRNECDYSPLKTTTADLCSRSITAGEIILNTCKNLVEAF